MNARIQELATLIRERNAVAQRITNVIGRPAQIGHVGEYIEYIASRVFNIQIEESAVAKGIDGVFHSGPLAGKTVNVKFYAKREGLLDVRPDAVPDYYLVLAGPRATAITSRGEARLWHIDWVFLFAGAETPVCLRSRGVKINEATSVIREQWNRAEVYPTTSNRALSPTEEQRNMLQLFHSNEVDG